MASLNIDVETGIVSDMSLMQAMCDVSDCRFTMRMHSASPVNGGRRLDSVAAQIKVSSNHVPSSSPLQAAGLLVSASLLPSAALRA